MLENLSREIHPGGYIFNGTVAEAQQVSLMKVII
jgi:hypothetical protein